MPYKAVILCKSRDEEVDIDPYAAALGRSDYLTWFVPVLEHEPMNLDALEHIMRDGPDNRFGGVIVTSARAAEMWTRVGENILASGGPG